MRDRPSILDTVSRKVSRPRARRLEDIFADIERGAPRGFTHIGEILPTVFKQIIRAIEERDSRSQAKKDDRPKA